MDTGGDGDGDEDEGRGGRAWGEGERVGRPGAAACGWAAGGMGEGARGASMTGSGWGWVLEGPAGEGLAAGPIGR
ncbi:MAG: hypothetical protein JWQ03_3253 [Variovorax sp.]|nr:hypothetical protein [Variovorax sp.]